MRNDVVLKNTPGLLETVPLAVIADVTKKSEQMRKEGKSPDGLLDPDSKDYYFTPGRLKQTADALRQQARSDAPKAGATIMKDGKHYEFKGGNPGDQKNWTEVSAPKGGSW